MTKSWTDALSIKLKHLQNSDSGVIEKGDIEGLIKEFLSIVDSYVSIQERHAIFDQIDKISQAVTDLKKEISVMGDNILQDNFIPEIAVELNSVISQTEKSVIGILDISDEIGKISTKILEPEIKKELQHHSTRILELCNFQDLTGQIIHKIIKRLTMIESTVNKIVDELGQDCQFSSHHHAAPDSLLNGPQKESDRPSQNEIDDLFTNLPAPK